ncbi:MAG: c-type cytochrome [Vicinamibacterales bacterium]
MRQALAGTVLLGMASAWGSTGAEVAAMQGKTQRDGVFTLEQAKRGETLYARSCASCHGADLATGEAPALTGPDFATAWNDLTLGDLFERIRIGMPQDKPGSLSHVQTADVVAFILFKGENAAGQVELPTVLEELKSIKFLATASSTP